MRRSRYKRYLLAFLGSEKSIVGTKPRPILRIRAWVIRKTPKADVSPYSSQISSLRMYNVKHFLYVKNSMSNPNHASSPVPTLSYANFTLGTMSIRP